jgi:acyl-CoA synthetase (AMP-forming)/AMP-acid ligase II
VNLYAVIERMSRERPSANFVSCDDEELSYAGFHQRVSRSAAALADLGVHRGDRVATLLRNRILGLEMMYGCAWVGAIWGPINAMTM